MVILGKPVYLRRVGSFLENMIGNNIRLEDKKSKGMEQRRRTLTKEGISPLGETDVLAMTIVRLLVQIAFD